jgi:hypothetical protein
VFWEYLASLFSELFDQRVREVYEEIDDAEDTIKAIQQIEPDDYFTTINLGWE